MMVRVIRPFFGKKIGRILCMPDGAANVRIKRGYVEAVEVPDKPQEENPKRSKRGRPRIQSGTQRGSHGGASNTA